MKTKMEGRRLIFPSESAKTIIDLVRDFSLDKSGGFYDYNSEDHFEKLQDICYHVLLSLFDKKALF